MISINVLFQICVILAIHDLFTRVKHWLTRHFLLVPPVLLWSLTSRVVTAWCNDCGFRGCRWRYEEVLSSSVILYPKISSNILFYIFYDINFCRWRHVLKQHKWQISKTELLNHIRPAYQMWRNLYLSVQLLAVYCDMYRWRRLFSSLDCFLFRYRYQCLQFCKHLWA